MISSDKIELKKVNETLKQNELINENELISESELIIRPKELSKELINENQSFNKVIEINIISPQFAFVQSCAIKNNIADKDYINRQFVLKKP